MASGEEDVRVMLIFADACAGVKRVRGVHVSILRCFFLEAARVESLGYRRQLIDEDKGGSSRFLPMPVVTKVSGITIPVSSMANSLRFYRDALGLKLLYGGDEESFSSFDVGGTYLNLELSPGVGSRCCRIILYCEDVDEMHEYLTSRGYSAPKPQDAPWQERFFHILDPDGHELSMARPLTRKS